MRFQCADSLVSCGRRADSYKNVCAFKSTKLRLKCNNFVCIYFFIPWFQYGKFIYFPFYKIVYQSNNSVQSCLPNIYKNKHRTHVLHVKSWECNSSDSYPVPTAHFSFFPRTHSFRLPISHTANTKRRLSRSLAIFALSSLRSLIICSSTIVVISNSEKTFIWPLLVSRG